MLSRELRTAILALAARGVAKRAIARELGIARATVRGVLRSREAYPPALARESRAEAHRDEILALYASCRGNLVRVHEELSAAGLALSYPALTAFCRREGIGQPPPRVAGRYPFEPGGELQHDTSPHKTVIAGKTQTVQSASSVLAFSGMIFFQAFPRFRRFHCKVHLTHTFRYFGGVTADVMIDNTHVVVLRGTGATMVPVPEMAAFAERLGFRFVAHEKGDVNRSARVERSFDFVERNFFAGRRFADLDDLNAQAREWCDRVAQRFVRTRRARPVELFPLERAALGPLPAWLPEPYELERRTVDVEGYVSFETRHYSVPEEWIGREVTVRATLAELTIEPPRGFREPVVHRRILLGSPRRITLPEHRRPRQWRARTDEELQRIEERAPELLDYARELAQRSPQQPTIALRHLLRMIREYPPEPMVAAVREAHHYGLYVLDRLEVMILRRIATDHFRFEEPDDEG